MVDHCRHDNVCTHRLENGNFNQMKTIQYVKCLTCTINCLEEIIRMQNVTKISIIKIVPYDKFIASY